MPRTFLSQLNWRFATKKFDPEKKVPQADLDRVLEAIRMTPSSYGLQIYHFFVITDQKLKDQIKEVSYHQDQVSDCSHLLVMCARTDLDKRVDEYVELVAEIQSTDPQANEKLREHLHKSMQSKAKDLFRYVSNQVYIALGFAMAACSELGIDSCPMEGFEPAEVDRLLKLPPHMKSVLLLPIGYRAEPPKRAKVRFAKEDLITFIK